jgi:hypothetical protein
MAAARLLKRTIKLAFIQEKRNPLRPKVDELTTILVIVYCVLFGTVRSILDCKAL